LAALEKAIDEFMRPPLRLISIDGETDGIRRGNLRLVKNDDPDDEIE
jgi:hypothetical protein